MKIEMLDPEHRWTTDRGPVMTNIPIEIKLTIEEINRLVELGKRNKIGFYPDEYLIMRGSLKQLGRSEVRGMYMEVDLP